MKKFLLIGLLGIAVVGAGIFFYLRSNARQLLEQFRPEIERVAADALGVPVKLKDLDLALSLAPVVKVGEVVIGADTERAVTLKDLFLSVDLYPLLSQELHVTKLRIQSPRIVAVKGAERIEIAGMPAPAGSPAGAGSSPSAQTPAAPNTMGFKLALKSIEVKDGELMLEDPAAGKKYAVTAIAIDAAVAAGADRAELKDVTVNASLAGKIPIALSAPSISLEPASGQLSARGVLITLLGGSVRADLTANSRTKAAEAKIHAQNIALDKLAPLGELIPAIAAFSPRGTVGAELSATIDPAGALQASGTAQLADVGAMSGPYTITGTTGTASLSFANQELKAAVKALALALNGAPISIDATPVATALGVTIPDLVLRAFGGTLRGEVSMSFGAPLTFGAKTVIEGMVIENALPVLQPGGAIPVTGTLKRVQSDLKGELGSSMMQTLSGSAAIEVTQATIKQFNFLGALLDSIRTVAYLSGGGIEGANSTDTVLNLLTGSFAIGGGRMTTKNLVAHANTFTFEGDGTLGFDGNVNLNATTAFTPESTAVMIAKAKEIARIVDTKERLVIPLTLVGKAPALTPLPNLQKITELAAKRIAKDQAGKALDKVLGTPGAGKALTDMFDF